MKLKGSKTEKNLLAAFAGESQARNRYTFFAKTAQQEGYEQIAGFFLETAENERQHAKQFFNHLEGGMVEITSNFPAGKIQSTKENLKASAEGEHEEWSKLYVEASKVAKEEGFNDIAFLFEIVSKIEKQHEERYLKLLQNLEASQVFKKEKEVAWICKKCGHIHFGKEAPKVCPACRHPQSYFEIKSENY
jgi:rubrerythrin